MLQEKNERKRHSCQCTTGLYKHDPANHATQSSILSTHLPLRIQPQPLLCSRSHPIFIPASHFHSILPSATLSLPPTLNSQQVLLATGTCPKAKLQPRSLVSCEKALLVYHQLHIPRNPHPKYPTPLLSLSLSLSLSVSLCLSLPLSLSLSPSLASSLPPSPSLSFQNLLCIAPM